MRAFFKKLIGVPSARDCTERLIRTGAVRRALDLGCGENSVLSEFRPEIRTAGIDAFAGAIETAKERKLHDDYLVADILKLSADEIRERFGGEAFDLVAAYDGIEHLPKEAGFELLKKCEALTSKYVLVQTPNGFLPQGPEFGNVYQRHLSGWFAQDFEGRGYDVVGTTGTKLFHGYAGELKFRFPGALICDALLGWFLRIRRNHRHAFNLVAIKDVRGVPARVGPASEKVRT